LGHLRYGHGTSTPGALDCCDRGPQRSQPCVNDAEGLLEAVIAGLGRSLLPCVIADADSRLQKLGGKLRGSVLSRELWLLTHSELRTFGRIEAVVEWIEQMAPH
jgi:DNA-binding transcriptional LysR family regulator